MIAGSPEHTKVLNTLRIAYAAMMAPSVIHSMPPENWKFTMRFMMIVMLAEALWPSAGVPMVGELPSQEETHAAILAEAIWPERLEVIS